MKVQVIEKEVEKKVEFPCLMINNSTGTIILATNKRDVFYIGTVISTPYYPLGYHSETWRKESFKPFKGEVRLSND